ncbi:CENPW protein, partial [Pedionomus torquatus]|nr:CENPW protein [Pedionomus torquatus]
RSGMRRTAPRGTLRRIIRMHRPQLRLAANADLLAWLSHCTFKQGCLGVIVHLSFLLFLHRLAEESRTNAFENKSKIIKPEHAMAAAKVI